MSEVSIEFDEKTFTDGFSVNIKMQEQGKIDKVRNKPKVKV